MGSSIGRISVSKTEGLRVRVSPHLLTKMCSRCKLRKPVSGFRKRKVCKDGYSGACKSCTGTYDKNWYKNNPHRKKQIRDNNEAQRQENFKFVFNYLDSHPCVDCGESDVMVLEFDHRKDSGKLKHIGDLMRGAISRKLLENEIAKCDVRCANCHRKKTAREQNHSRWVLFCQSRLAVDSTGFVNRRRKSSGVRLSPLALEGE